MMNLRRILRNRLAERATFGRTTDWLWSLYDRALHRWKHGPLPGRHRICRVSVPGFSAPVALRLGTTDWLVLQELYGRDEYGVVFAAELGPMRQIIDLGANIGLSVRLWRAHYPGAHIIAVEPDEGNFAMLEENVRLAESQDFVTSLRACAMGYVRPVELAGVEGEWAFSARDVAQSGLKVLTIPDLLGRGEQGGMVDLLKCDIEGAEGGII